MEVTTAMLFPFFFFFQYKKLNIQQTNRKTCQRPLILVDFSYLVVNIRDHLLSTTTNIQTFDGFGIPAIPLLQLLASYVELFFFFFLTKFFIIVYTHFGIKHR